MVLKKICVQHEMKIKDFREVHKGNNKNGVDGKLRAAFYTKKLWPINSKIRIGFIENGDQIKRSNIPISKEVDPLQETVGNMSVIQAIKKIVRERIKPLVNLDIEFVDNVNQANVRISFDPKVGSYSLVGTDHLHKKSGATMNFGWFDVPTIIHEFCHMLGMIHEHQNPRGEAIKWDDEAVFAWAKKTQGWSEKTTETNIIDKYSNNIINGSNFDPDSIMLYFFPASLTTDNVGTKQNLKFSAEDVLWISKMYPIKDGITPQEFYKKIYNQKLEDAVKESKKKAAQAEEDKDKDKSVDYKSIGIGIGIVIGILVVVFFLKWLLKERNIRRSNRRFGVV